MHQLIRLCLTSLPFLQSAAALALPPSLVERAPIPQASISLSSTDLTALVLPDAPSALPSPSKTLTHVLIGRGIQNYTCTSTSPDTIPTPLGALATLYDATSPIDLASPTVDTFLSSLAFSLRLHTLPSLSKDSGFTSLFAGDACASPFCNMLLPFVVGHHFFSDSTTPVFDLRTSNGDQGVVTTAKMGNSSAPTTAQSNSVDWLYLLGKDGDGKEVQVYRVETVGGKQPASCEDVVGDEHGVFSRQYAAQYWFYS